MVACDCTALLTYLDLSVSWPQLDVRVSVDSKVTDVDLSWLVDLYVPFGCRATGCRTSSSAFVFPTVFVGQIYDGQGSVRKENCYIFG